MVLRESRLGCGDRFAAQQRFIEIAVVPHFARQQLDLQVAKTEGEEVGGEIRVDGRQVTEWGQGPGQHLLPIGEVSHQHTTARLGTRGPVGGEPPFTVRWDKDQPAHRGVGRVVGTMPTGQGAGRSQEMRVPGDRERVQQRRGLGFSQLGGEVFEAVAGNESQQIFVAHGLELIATGIVSHPVRGGGAGQRGVSLGAGAAASHSRGGDEFRESLPNQPAKPVLWRGISNGDRPVATTAVKHPRARMALDRTRAWEACDKYCGFGVRNLARQSNHQPAGCNAADACFESEAGKPSSVAEEGFEPPTRGL